MSGRDVSAERLADLSVENVGGIEEAEVTIPPGVTVLAGRNATNRTSLLRSIMAVCGSDDVSIKADADSASVTLDLDGEIYTRRLERRSGGVVADGEPVLEDPTLADTFAFLLESNTARRAVERGDDLREIIMDPVDTAAIEREIDELVEERRSLTRELEAIDERKAELPELEERRAELTDDIEAKRAALESVEDDLEARNGVEASPDDDSGDLEETLATLQDRRSALEELRYDLDTERESLEALETERAGLREERDELAGTAGDDIDTIEAEIEELRARKQSLDATVTDLHNVVQFNEGLLEGSDGTLDAVLGESTTEGSVTDALVETDTVTCWTCGSEVARADVESTLERLRSFSRDRIEARNEVEAELEARLEERRTIEERRERRREIDARLDDIEVRIAECEETIEDLEATREALVEEIENLEAAVSELESESNRELLERHREANELEFEIDRLERERSEVESDIAEIEERLDERASVERRRESVREDLESLRTRIERLETDAVDAFNEHMAAILERLGYDNLDRIWLERREGTEDTRGEGDTATFDLHIVRTTASGTAYEDTVDHLSESERTVTGLVFALAGYLVHDVHETVPFMLLDSLESVDAPRIASLVDYFESFPSYLVVALLSEDADALDDRYPRITEI